LDDICSHSTQAAAPVFSATTRTAAGGATSPVVGFTLQGRYLHLGNVPR
jgi:hypothetical protein